MNQFLKSFIYAFNGIALSLKQRNMKIHICCAILVISGGFVFKITQTEWFAILICIGVVLSLEMVNTAIEHLVDLVEPNHNPKAGAIKDIAAGAVLVSAIISCLIGIMIFGKYILDLIFP